MRDVYFKRDFVSGHSLRLCVSLLVAGCSADMPTSKSSGPAIAQRPDLDAAAPGMPDERAANMRDSGVVPRGAGMPIVPIHRADAGSSSVHDAGKAMPATKPPPVIVAAADAGHDSGTDAAKPATPQRDAGSAMAPPAVEPPLPEPLRRYSFSGAGNAVHDEHGGPDAIVEGNAQLDGAGAVVFPGQGNGAVKLPEGFLSGLTSFTLLVWLEARSQACWQRAIDFLDVHQPSGNGNPNPPELTSLYLTPYGCPDALPTLGYVNPSSKYHLISQTQITQSEPLQLGMSYSGRSRTLRLIVNGIVAKEQSVPVDLPAVQHAQAWLGRSHVDGDPQLHGSITELRVYEGTLSDSELRALFEHGPDRLH